jgi:hypothetical protein
MNHKLKPLLTILSMVLLTYAIRGPVSKLLTAENSNSIFDSINTKSSQGMLAKKAITINNGTSRVNTESERKLQSAFGGYTIGEAPKKKIHCEDKGIKESDIVISNGEAKDSQVSSRITGEVSESTLRNMQRPVN